MMATVDAAGTGRGTPADGLLAQCAESIVYLGTYESKRVVVKHRMVKPYRHALLDGRLREQRTAREARALVRCRLFGVPTPAVYAVDKSNCSIVMEYISGIAVKDVLHRAHRRMVATDVEVEGGDGSSGPAFRPSPLERQLLVTIGEVVGMLHNGDIIHGDLTTSNFIYTGPEAEQDEAAALTEAGGASLPVEPPAKRPRQETSPVAPSEPSALLASASLVGITQFLHGKARQDGNEGAVYSACAPYKGLVVIDFGLVINKNSPEERAVDLYVLERAIRATHPHLESVASDLILEGYRATVEEKKGRATLQRLEVVRSRGRKRSMLG